MSLVFIPLAAMCASPGRIWAGGWQEGGGERQSGIVFSRQVCRDGARSNLRRPRRDRSCNSISRNRGQTRTKFWDPVHGKLWMLFPLGTACHLTHSLTHSKERPTFSVRPYTNKQWRVCVRMWVQVCM